MIPNCPLCDRKMIEWSEPDEFACPECDFYDGRQVPKNNLKDSNCQIMRKNQLMSFEKFERLRKLQAFK